MRIFGYEEGKDILLRMDEVSFECNLNELKRLICFLQDTYDEHYSARLKTDICHSHLRDWDKMWNTGEPDVVVVTKFNK